MEVKDGNVLPREVLECGGPPPLLYCLWYPKAPEGCRTPGRFRAGRNWLPAGTRRFSRILC